MDLNISQAFLKCPWNTGQTPVHPGGSSPYWRTRRRIQTSSQETTKRSPSTRHKTSILWKSRTREPRHRILCRLKEKESCPHRIRPRQRYRPLGRTHLQRKRLVYNPEGNYPSTPRTWLVDRIRPTAPRPRWPRTLQSNSSHRYRTTGRRNPFRRNLSHRNSPRNPFVRRTRTHPSPDWSRCWTRHPYSP